MSLCRHIDVWLDLTPEQVLRYYRGGADAVVARSLDGRMVRFPAGVLPRLVTADGVRGRYRLKFDRDHRLQAVEALDLGTVSAEKAGD